MWNMAMSPDSVLSGAWALWLASWLIAALWSSRVQRRLNSRADGAQRLFTTR
jgi:hypothetical protein